MALEAVKTEVLAEDAEALLTALRWVRHQVPSPPDTWPTQFPLRNRLRLLIILGGQMCLSSVMHDLRKDPFFTVNKYYMQLVGLSIIIRLQNYSQ